MTKYQIQQQQTQQKDSSENRRIGRHERVISDLLDGSSYSTEVEQ